MSPPSLAPQAAGQRVITIKTHHWPAELGRQHELFDVQTNTLHAIVHVALWGRARIPRRHQLRMQPDGGRHVRSRPGGLDQGRLGMNFMHTRLKTDQVSANLMG